MPAYNISPTATLADRAVCRFHEVNELYDGTLNSICAYAFSTLALDMTNNEVFTYTKAMQQPDASDFIAAMDKEIDDHQSRGHWEIVRRSTIPPGMKTIQAIWSFKRKRYPDGTLNKHKARLCAHGGMQQWGVSYWETYSPVVNMLTVRLLLALCNIHGLESKSIDFILAFPQADLDVDIWMEHNSFELSQPFLIDRILNFLGLCNNDFETDANSTSTPVARGLLHRDLDGKPRKYAWKYRTAVGMLSYLQNTSRPEISMAVHQTARFSNNPMLSHEKSIMRIGRYLLDTRKRGIIYKPDKSKGLECYVDADFAGGWSQADSDNADNVLSRTGYILMYANCPILWVSRLQTEIALSTAEAEYIALSQSLRDVIPLITLLKEINKVFPVHVKTPTFVCKVHEDNQSCITMATSQKFTPRTKHIALKYHHFRSHVKNGAIQISYCRTTEQKADLLTKPLADDLFFKLRYMLSGW
jgi:hypothetical protein